MYLSAASTSGMAPNKCLENVDDILAVPGVDIMFIGMFDLTVSLGHSQGLIFACLEPPATAKKLGFQDRFAIFSKKDEKRIGW